ncbi:MULTISPECIES: hypothetical protein [Streptomyces]|uniref:hypothetical protein n=1 Tax=Streptomyces TaxID=1883 RepID=UPI00131E3F1A|nr:MULTISPECIES: hypothetical protein [Streptomyces]MBP2348909.1 hypothetical protein [Streptomyces virginiae]MCI4085610.1 hypothetical protein [Streptomyces sp. MMS21 TC-5]QNE23435.1 hypothetical protein F1D59_00400 [Streptomyces sp. INR7]
MHDVGGEETEANRRVVRWVEAGFDGQWGSVSEPCNEWDTALERLQWCRVHAPLAVSYRLVRMTARVTSGVENV